MKVLVNFWRMKSLLCRFLLRVLRYRAARYLMNLRVAFDKMPAVSTIASHMAAPYSVCRAICTIEYPSIAVVARGIATLTVVTNACDIDGRAINFAAAFNAGMAVIAPYRVAEWPTTVVVIAEIDGHICSTAN